MTEPGMAVYGTDGEKVGTVGVVQPTSLIVEEGVFFRHRYDVPAAAIGAVTDLGVHLSVTKAAATGQGWDTEPADERPEGFGVGEPADQKRDDSAS